MRLHRHLFVPLAAALCAAVALAFSTPAAQGADSEPLRVVDHEGKYADILVGDRVVVRYVYERDTSSKERDFDTAKVFAHVIGPDGEQPLTNGPGSRQYPHHRGIFLGWNKIEQGGETHDLWHVRGTAQEHRELTHRVEDAAAEITARIDWIGKGGKTLIQEKRTHRLVRDPATYATIEFTSELTAVAGDLVLQGDPEHAGVQFRASQHVADNQSATYTYHAADIDPSRDLDLPWVACSFQIGDTAWTVQQINHAGNPSGTRWSAYRNYGRFGAFPVIEIPEGETKTLRYRFRITQGETPAREALNTAAKSSN